MGTSKKEVDAAMRILTALVVGERARPQDILALVQFAGPKPEGMDLNDFARKVIRVELKRRADLQQRRRED